MSNYAITIEWHVKIRAYTSLSNNPSGIWTAGLDFYSKKQAVSVYLLDSKSFNDITSSYREFSFKTQFAINDTFYWCWYWQGKTGYGMYVSDYYYTVHYPDTTNLYL